MDSTKGYQRPNILDTANYIQDDFLYFCHIIMVTIGIPFNILVIGIIVFFKRPYHLPRNFTWLGIEISNIFLLGTHLMEHLYVRWWSSSPSRGLSTWLVPLSFAVQMCHFLLIAVPERFIFLTYPNWHKRRITTRFILTLQFGSYLFIFMVLVGVMMNLENYEEYMTQLISSWNFKLIASFILGFFPVILIVQVGFVRFKTKQNFQNIKVINLNSLFEEQQQDCEMIGTDDNQHQRISFLVHMEDTQQANPLELEAARSVYFITKVYLLFMAPICISFYIVSACLQDNADHYDDNVNCSSYIRGFYYTAGLLSCFHSSIVNPGLVFYLL